VKAGTGIVFVLLPGGTVTLDSQKDDPNAPFYDPQREDNETLRKVTLSPFLLARHELTQGQWSRLWTWDTELRVPSLYKSGQSIGGKKITMANPVESVDWGMSDRLLTRHGMSLPTEAQWEYGCRGGTTTPWNVTLADLRKVANVADADAKRAVPSWTCETWADGHVVHASVGSFGANGFGLYDVHGNVWEWCRDHSSDYGSERSGDGVRPDSADRSASRVYRGGCFDDPAANARSAVRGHDPPSNRNYNLGLRPARLITF
jgi:formylglycine-generating enzyme required for sulfatase activity